MGIGYSGETREDIKKVMFGKKKVKLGLSEMVSKKTLPN
jgi:hypothetical protein